MRKFDFNVPIYNSKTTNLRIKKMNKVLIFFHLRQKKSIVIKRVIFTSSIQYENSTLQHCIERKNRKR